jgi:mannan endo-1,4-beta-mannosidase
MPTRRQFLGRAGAAGVAFGSAFLATGRSAAADATGTTPGTGGRHRHFVTARRGRFYVGQQPWRFSGTNTYYLHYKSHFMIDDALGAAAAMGLRVIRVDTFMDGAGQEGVALQPEPFSYDEESFDRIDYSVWKAGQLGLRLVVTLTNNWPDFGGIPQYATWFDAEHDDFFRRTDIKDCYRAWVRHVLKRRNRYTGMPNTQDPTVMTWELANEPRCQSDKSGDTLVEWADEMSRLVKSLAPSQLVAVGDEGFYGIPGHESYPYSDWEGVAWKRLTALPAVDYGTVHLYPEAWGQAPGWGEPWIRDHIRDGRKLGKPVVIEEYGIGDQTVRDALYAAWTGAVEEEGGAGDQFWLLTGLQDDGTLYPDYDGLRITYPSATATLLAEHAARMAAKR